MVHREIFRVCSELIPLPCLSHTHKFAQIPGLAILVILKIDFDQRCPDSLNTRRRKGQKSFMSRIELILSITIVMIFFCAATTLQAQKPPETRKHENVSALPLESVHIEAQSIEALFSDLSLQHDILIGLEIASNDDPFARYDIEFKRGTIADFLNQFTKAYNLYAWDVKDGVINIFPKDGYRDLVLDSLLNTQIANFRIEANTSCWKAVDLLLATAEVKHNLQASGITQGGLNFTGVYFPQLGREFTLDVSDMTVKSILNKVVKDSPLTRIWVSKKYGYEQTFFIRLYALHEGSPLRRTTSQEKP